MVHPTLRLSALSLINPATLLEVFVVISAQQLLASCAVSLVNENVMKVGVAEKHSLTQAVFPSAVDVADAHCLLRCGERA